MESRTCRSKPTSLGAMLRRIRSSRGALARTMSAGADDGKVDHRQWQFTDIGADQC